MQKHSPPSNGGEEAIRSLLGTTYEQYVTLAGAGCDHLAGLLFMLREGAQTISAEGVHSRKLVRYRRDSYPAMLNGLSLKEARSRIKKLRAAIKKLAPLMEPFDGTRLLGYGGLTYAMLFEQLQLRTDTLAQKLGPIGPKVHPDVTGVIGRIIRYVWERTDQFYDKELSEVLEAAIGGSAPSGYPRFPSAEALRMWRFDHGLTTAALSKSKIVKS